MSSLGEISVTIRAVNEATPTFEAIGSDAAAMGSAVGASARGFETLQAQAEATTVSLRTVASAIGSIAHMGTAVVTLAGDMGLVDKETAKWMRTMMAVFTLVSAFTRLQYYMTVLTTGHTAAVTLNTTAQTANASSSILVATAHNIKTAATWLAVKAQNALNVSHATFLALTGIGIGVIIAAAAAMAYFASQMNAATASVEKYNAAVAETSERTRGITRAGEEALYRRGVES